ncbi:MAG: helix-turn-helix domain-containing protein [Deltaproteobacteria bacterium]|nr:helix-turn-helix domain-containing protein [Deltaproteobacteria bacterium]
MQLSQSEIIQTLRKRAGLNQADLGSRAFNTTIDSGRTKIKNIELGKQRASDDDLKRIAQCLNVTPEELQPSPKKKRKAADHFNEGVLVSQKVVDMFPDLGEYLEMLEKASMIDDIDLIEYLSKKLADIWRAGPKMDAQSAIRVAETP